MSGLEALGVGAERLQGEGLAGALGSADLVEADGERGAGELDGEGRRGIKIVVPLVGERGRSEGEGSEAAIRAERGEREVGEAGLAGEGEGAEEVAEGGVDVGSDQQVEVARVAVRPGDPSLEIGRGDEGEEERIVVDAETREIVAGLASVGEAQLGGVDLERVTNGAVGRDLLSPSIRASRGAPRAARCRPRASARRRGSYAEGRPGGGLVCA